MTRNRNKDLNDAEKVTKSLFLNMFKHTFRNLLDKLSRIERIQIYREEGQNYIGTP